jgi:hypothetical protein
MNESLPSCDHSVCPDRLDQFLCVLHQHGIVVMQTFVRFSASFFWYFALNAMKPSFPSGVFQDYHVLTVQSIVLQILIFAYMIHRLVAESFSRITDQSKQGATKLFCPKAE